MKKYIYINFIIVICTTFIGCTSMTGVPDRSINVKEEMTSLKEYLSPNIINTYNSKNGIEKKEFRNDVILARIRAIDLNFNKFVKNFSVEKKSTSIGSDATLLLLGAAGAVSTVSSTQKVISASSAAVTGLNASIDKNAYFDNTIQALVTQMTANRKKILVNLYLGMDMSVNEYPLMRALVDLEDYFQAGTIIGAVNEINKTSGEQKAKSDNELNNILKGTYKKDKAGDKIRSFWKPDGKTINRDNEKKIKEWMNNNGLDNSSITFFINADYLADARLKAVNDIPIP